MLKYVYDSKDDIPEGVEAHYKEKDGKFYLQLEGAKTQADVDRVQKALKDERDAHKATKDKFKALGDRDPQEIIDGLDKLEELQSENEALKKKTEGGDDPAAIDRLVEVRVKRVLAPVERERDALKKQVGELTGERDTLKGGITKRDIEGAVRDDAISAKVSTTALPDVLMYAGSVFEVAEGGKVLTRDGVEGVAPGLTPKEWLKDMEEKRPHWWALSNGGGAHRPGGAQSGDNPWSAKAWSITNQGRFIREHGMEKANQYAKNAGSSVGATAPPKAA